MCIEDKREGGQGAPLGYQGSVTSQSIFGNGGTWHWVTNMRQVNYRWKQNAGGAHFILEGGGGVQVQQVRSSDRGKLNRHTRVWAMEVFAFIARCLLCDLSKMQFNWLIIYLVKKKHFIDLVGRSSSIIVNSDMSALCFVTAAQQLTPDNRTN